MTKVFALLVAFCVVALALSEPVTYKYASCLEDPACRNESLYAGQMTEVMRLIRRDHAECFLAGECPIPENSISSNRVHCVDGMAGEYPCSGVDLLSFVSLSDMGGSSIADGNDIWGWKDPLNGDLYAIAGLTTGTSFVRVTDPENPVVLAWMPAENPISTAWRDMKVYGNYAYIVADRSGQNLQYFDLTRLRALNGGPYATVSPDGVYIVEGRGNTHNIVMNEQTGIAYLVGTSHCGGGLYMLDVTQGKPVYAGCFSADGYTHDAQCLVYEGPDTRYSGHSVCFAYNEDTLTIVDVTDPSNPEMISRVGYDGSAYTHQGWLTDDHEYLFLDDELDEKYGSGDNTGHARTLLWSVQDLENPKELSHFDSPVLSIDHNLYVEGNYVYEANYEAGLRVLEHSGAGADLRLEQIAFFDTFPERDSVAFNGAWSVYPYFDDFVVVEDINRGLFVLSKPTST